jgi:hypothetical protein
MNDIMVDLETMDNVASAAIVSIGAVECNLITGETGDTFYRVVELEGQTDLGMTINSETLYWWLKQSDAAREALVVEGRLSLKEMCEAFDRWVHYLDASNKKLRLWGNGASFDNAILRYAFRQLGETFPTEWWNDRDMRTIVGFYPTQLQYNWKHSNYRTGTHHNALSDAKYQVKYCSDILKELGVKELY